MQHSYSVSGILKAFQIHFSQLTHNSQLFSLRSTLSSSSVSSFSFRFRFVFVFSVNFFTKLYNFAYNKKFTSSAAAAASFAWRTFFVFLLLLLSFLCCASHSLTNIQTHSHSHSRTQTQASKRNTNFFFTIKSFPATFCVEFLVVVFFLVFFLIGCFYYYYNCICLFGISCFNLNLHCVFVSHSNSFLIMFCCRLTFTRTQARQITTVYVSL